MQSNNSLANAHGIQILKKIALHVLGVDKFDWIRQNQEDHLKSKRELFKKVAELYDDIIYDSLSTACKYHPICKSFVMFCYLIKPLQWPLRTQNCGSRLWIC